MYSMIFLPMMQRPTQSQLIYLLLLLSMAGVGMLTMLKFLRSNNLCSLVAILRLGRVGLCRLRNSMALGWANVVITLMRLCALNLLQLWASFWGSYIMALMLRACINLVLMLLWAYFGPCFGLSRMALAMSMAFVLLIRTLLFLPIRGDVTAGMLVALVMKVLICVLPF